MTWDVTSIFLDKEIVESSFTKIKSFSPIGEIVAKEPDRRPGYRLIFRPWITTKDGRIIWAKTYGKRAFAIWVKE